MISEVFENAGAIGMICKQSASISGSEVGCQGWFDLQPSCLPTRGVGVQLTWAMALEVIKGARELNLVRQVLAEHEVRAFGS